MRIRAIIPNSGMDRATLASRERMLAAALAGDTEISVVCIRRGPESIEHNTDEALAGAEVVKEVVRAEREGFNAAVVYCFSDLAVEAAREAVAIPVIGPGEITMAIANMLGEKLCVVTTVADNIPRTERRLRKNAAACQKLVSVRSLDIPVTDLRNDPDSTQRYLEAVCRRAVDEDGADTVVLGCLGLAQYGGYLEKKYGVTVLDPAFIAVAYAELCARLHILHNRRAYPAYERGELLEQS